jgi:NAD(P)-dependent dehydrogenase (short-subunit alcohol dehydrogenase family)
MSTEFAGRTALVTGAGRGIGRALALGLADAGASLILLARSADQLAETQAIAQARGALPGQVKIMAADLADEEQRAAAAAATVAAIRMDILINNAATVEPLGETGTIAAGQLRRAFEINVVAAAALSAAVLPGMLEAGWGRIVNISSGIAAHPEGMIRGNAYATTKAALEAHTRNLAAELAGTGVTANVYRPGGVDTAMQAWIRGQDPARIGTAMHDRFTRSYADGTLITPEQSAAALLARLSTDDTGAIWEVTATPAGSSGTR